MKYIITESQDNKVKDLFINLVDKKGFIIGGRAIGGFEKLLNLLGDDYFNQDRKIKLIKEIILSTGYRHLSLYEIDESPILVRDEDGEFNQIEVLSPDDVAIFHYVGYEDTQEVGQSYEEYENLPYRIINEIFNMVVNYYIGGY
jgi:hypothetical protein